MVIRRKRLSEELFGLLMLIFCILWKTSYLRGQRETVTGMGGGFVRAILCFFFFSRFGDMSSYNVVYVTLMAKQQNGQCKTV